MWGKYPKQKCKIFAEWCYPNKALLIKDIIYKDIQDILEKTEPYKYGNLMIWGGANTIALKPLFFLISKATEASCYLSEESIRYTAYIILQQTAMKRFNCHKTLHILL